MFTGIVQELGRLQSSAEAPHGGRRLVFRSSLSDVSALGDSIAVNGCCLTVVDVGPGWWAADAVSETLGRTNLAAVSVGDPVNIELPVAVGDRLGGHLVQGHVDGVGTVVTPAPDLSVAAPATVMPYLIEKGSITVDGVSLTVVSVGESSFSVAVIPHTMAVTTLGTREVGDSVNLEADVIAKYTERLLHSGVQSPYLEL